MTESQVDCSALCGFMEKHRVIDGMVVSLSTVTQVWLDLEFNFNGYLCEISNHTSARFAFWNGDNVTMYLHTVPSIFTPVHKRREVVHTQWRDQFFSDIDTSNGLSEFTPEQLRYTQAWHRIWRRAQDELVEATLTDSFYRLR